MSKPMIRPCPAIWLVRDRADHAPRRPGQDRVLALEAPRPGQPARGLHEHELAAHVARRRPPPPGRCSAAGSASGRRRPPWCRRGCTIFISGLTRWLTETCANPAASRQLRRPRLVRLVAVAVHEDDGAGAEPRRPRLGQRRAPDAPRRAAAPRCRRRAPARAPRSPGRRASPAARCAGRRAAAGSGRRAAAAAPSPCVVTSTTGSPLRSRSALVATVVPILTLATRSAGIGAPAAEPEEAADAVQRRVRVLLGVLRQELRPVQPPVRIARDDVGEGAAAVDPEVPARHAGAHACPPDARPLSMPRQTMQA